MKEKVQVLDFEIDNYTAKDAVKKVVSYMSTEPLNVVEMVTMYTIGQFQEGQQFLIFNS